MVKLLVDLFKVRIGVLMAITALVALMVTPGRTVQVWEAVILSLSVLFASSSAGAFNQYFERDLDARMRRTQHRAFVTGAFEHSIWWLLPIALLLVIGVGGAALTLNSMAALYVFLGAFFYAVVYTIWLKRRTWLNIVVGGAAGSFAVLAGAAVVDPNLGPIPIILAIVLFLWTPPHFWSLAIAQREEYASVGVPMLPVVVGEQGAANAILWNTTALVICSVLPFFFGLGWFYLFGALAGGGYFLFRSLQLVRAPSRKTAMNSFFASLIQLVVLLLFAVIDVI
ncbi:heme o synthase [Pseudomonadota bacterium]